MSEDGRRCACGHARREHHTDGGVCRVLACACEEYRRARLELAWCEHAPAGDCAGCVASPGDVCPARPMKNLNDRKNGTGAVRAAPVPQRFVSSAGAARTHTGSVRGTPPVKPREGLFSNPLAPPASHEED